MELLDQYHFYAGAALARVFLGFLFFFQGYDAVFGIGLRNVTAAYREGFDSKPVPSFLITAAAWYTSWTELVGGMLLVFGLFQFPALCLLGLNLLVAAVGFGIKQPLWDTRFVFPRLVLLLLLLLVPWEWHNWSLDTLLF